MKRIIKILWIFLLPLLINSWNSAGVLAETTLRCQNRIISVGDSKLEVMEKCGKPDHIDCWEEGRNSYISQLYDYERDRYQAPNMIKGPLVMERWTYDSGTYRLKRIMHFQNGKLTHIETGDK
jgi:hypothetical protein